MVGASTSSFGDQLRRLREAAGLTQEELAERSGLSRDAISALERGRRRHPHPHTIRAMADVLGLSEPDRQSLRASARKPASAEPPLPTRNTTRRLPVPATTLVGRNRELADVRERLHDGVRLVTLTGPAGVGKTRLAIQVALDIQSDLSEPAVFVPFASIQDHSLIIPTIADVLGVRDQGGAALPELIHHAVKDRRIFVILDNLEHLSEASPAISELLAACPELTVLATSREALRVSGEHEYPVSPLATPRSDQTPDPATLAENGAVALFVQRARAVKPDFLLTDANASTVAAICARLDGLPLAIELAAARIKILSPAALLSRLNTRLDLLAGGPRDQVARLRSLRAAIAWSYDLLARDERTLFRQLSVFADSFTLDAAAAIAGGDQIAPSGEAMLDRIAALVDKSLIRSIETDGGEPRFGMLQTIQEYGLEQLVAAGERETARACHGKYYLQLAEKAYQTFRDRVKQKGWLDHLELERGNLREALTWCAECGETASLICLAGSLYWFWYARGPLSEGRAWLEQALAVPTSTQADISRIRALVGAGLLAHFQGDEQHARSWLEESLTDPDVHPDTWLHGFALFLLGIVAEGEGDYALAELRFHDAYALFEDVADLSNASIALAHLGVTAYGLGDGERGMALCREAAERQRAIGDTWGLGISLGYFALLACEQGAYGQSAAAYRECITLSWRVRVPADIAGTLEDMATLAVSVGQPKQAARFIGAASTIRSAADRASPNLPERAIFERTLDGIRGALGDSSFAQAKASGAELSLETAVSEALAFAGETADQHA